MLIRGTTSSTTSSSSRRKSSSLVSNMISTPFTALAKQKQNRKRKSSQSALPPIQLHDDEMPTNSAGIKQLKIPPPPFHILQNHGYPSYDNDNVNDDDDFESTLRAMDLTNEFGLSEYAFNLLDPEKQMEYLRSEMELQSQMEGASASVDETDGNYEADDYDGEGNTTYNGDSDSEVKVPNGVNAPDISDQLALMLFRKRNFKWKKHFKKVTICKRIIYKCTTCEKCITRQDNLLEHHMVHTGEKPFQCPICNFSMRAKFTFKNHMVCHQKNENFQTPLKIRRRNEEQNLQAQKSNLSSNTHLAGSSMKRIKRSSSQNASIKVPQKVKGNNFSSIQKVQIRNSIPVKNSSQTQMKLAQIKERSIEHLKVLELKRNYNWQEDWEKIDVNGVVRYRCLECNQSVSRKENLLIHKTIHTGQKFYNCTECSKSFRVLTSLEQHMKNLHYSNTDEVKLYKCRYCPKTYKSLLGKSDHESLHKKAFLHQCPICSAQIKYTSNYHHHMRKHKSQQTIRPKRLSTSSTINNEFYPSSPPKMDTYFDTAEVTNDELEDKKPKLCLPLPKLKYYGNVHQSNKPVETEIKIEPENEDMIHFDDDDGENKSELEDSGLNNYEEGEEQEEEVEECEIKPDINSFLAVTLEELEEDPEEVNEEMIAMPYLKNETFFRDSELDISYNDDENVNYNNMENLASNKQNRSLENNPDHQLMLNKIRNYVWEQDFKTVEMDGRILYECQECQSILRNKKNLYPHKQIHTGERLYNCRYCPKTFRLLRILEGHEALHRNKKKFQCAICSKKFHSAIDYGEHMNKHEEAFNSSSNVTDTVMENLSFAQENPAEITSQEVDVPRKRSRYESIQNRSLIHEMMLERKRNYNWQIDFDFDDKKYTCKICQTLISRKENLLPHKQIHTGEKPYTCSVCSKTFRLLKILESHELLHKNTKKFICEICSRKMHNLEDYNLHMNGHNTIFNKLSSTNSNSNSNISKIELNDDSMDTSTLEESNENDNDQPALLPSNSAKRDPVHEKLLILIRNYLWTKDFDQVKGLDDRVQYICKICKSVLHNKRSLYPHNQIHVKPNEKPYKCNYCEFRFRTHLCKKNHENSMHINPVKSHYCDICDFSMKAKFTYDNHMLCHSKNPNYRISNKIRNRSDQRMQIKQEILDYFENDDGNEEQKFYPDVEIKVEKQLNDTDLLEFMQKEWEPYGPESSNDVQNNSYQEQEKEPAKSKRPYKRKIRDEALVASSQEHFLEPFDWKKNFKKVQIKSRVYYKCLHCTKLGVTKCIPKLGQLEDHINDVHKRNDQAPVSKKRRTSVVAKVAKPGRRPSLVKVKTETSQAQVKNVEGILSKRSKSIQERSLEHEIMLERKRTFEWENYFRKVQIEDGKVNYQCVSCEQYITRFENLLPHHFIHTGERPYSCNSCGKRFRLLRILEGHLKTHEPHICKFCFENFPNLKNKNHHQNRCSYQQAFSNQLPYKCDKELVVCLEEMDQSTISKYKK